MPFSRLIPVRRLALLRGAGLWLIAALLVFAWHGQEGDPTVSAVIDGALTEAAGLASHAPPGHPAPASGDGHEAEPDDATCTKASRLHAACGGANRIAAFPISSAGRPFTAYRAQAPPRA